MEEIIDGDTVWRFDVEFLRSNWTCIFGRGCVGILPEPAEHLGLGRCSMGADLDVENEGREGEVKEGPALCRFGPPGPGRPVLFGV